ncbi:MbcA/ParS/Xre antitoxin family protein [uncultured Algimonas sp.]|uniref:MbcA/ParS/Xre antitoxin family protein n=1 Tax=uncultured Algimonas sp. TaxID=1547920 RepID=UPI00260D0271|nr:MbcA/ParS/Xre antitoxin family protein [uncultured Algimonas sp.]
MMLELVEPTDSTPLVPLDLDKDQDRVAKRAFVRLMALWGLRDSDASTLLGHAAVRTYQRWKAGEYGRPLTIDTLERISNLLGIHKALGILFEEKSQRDAWIGKPNAAFDGRSALEIMLEGRLIGLMRVRRYLDAVRGG